MHQRAPDIFAYLDYRAFLGAWVAWCRTTQQGFSFQSFAEAAGLSRSALPNVLAGTRAPRPATIDALGRGMGLDPNERNYLALLVELEAAPTIAARREVLGRVTGRVVYRQKEWTEEPPSTVARYLAKWYHAAIRELAQLPGFQARPEWVSTALHPPISVDDAAAALDLLFGTGLLLLEADGRVTVPALRVESHLDPADETMTRYHEEVVPHLLARLRDTPASERHCVTRVTTLGADGLVEARRLLAQAVDRIGAVGGSPEDQQGRRVYQVAIQVLPLTRPLD